MVYYTFWMNQALVCKFQRDNHRRLIHSLEQLRDLGNTVIVVEHDREMMESADMLLDIGPRGGGSTAEEISWRMGHRRCFSLLRIGRIPQMGISLERIPPTGKIFSWNFIL